VFLILADAADSSATWLADALRRRLVSVSYVTPLELLRARWTARLSGRRGVIEIELADGRTIATNRVRGTINRVACLPYDVLEPISNDDREYAAQELFALCLAFLDRLPPPVWNPPTPRWLAGPSLHELEWGQIAARAGFHVATREWAADQTDSSVAHDGGRPVIVLDDYVTPDTPAIADCCRKLARLAKAPLLEVRVDGQSTFRRASPLADFRLGGEQLVEELLARSA
jgi:hypothetical protein